LAKKSKRKFLVKALGGGLKKKLPDRRTAGSEKGKTF
jgi:hypothetical protein